MQQCHRLSASPRRIPFIPKCSVLGPSGILSYVHRHRDARDRQRVNVHRKLLGQEAMKASLNTITHTATKGRVGA